MTLTALLAVLIFAMACVLWAVDLWNWWDSYCDYQAAHTVSSESPLRVQAKGFLRAASLRLLEGWFWLLLSVVILRNLSAGRPAIPARVVIVFLIALQLGKALTDRMTRTKVMEAANRGNQWRRRASDYSHD